MKRVLIGTALSCVLATVSGCSTINDLLGGRSSAPAPVESATPLPPRADSLPKAVLTEDVPAAAAGTASAQAAGQSAGQALEIESFEPAVLAPGGNVEILGSISGSEAAPGEVEILTARQPQRPAGVGAVLPDYASGSNLGSVCDVNKQSAARTGAASAARMLLAGLDLGAGEIFAAPTIIPDELQDCTPDFSADVSGALSAAGFNVSQGSRAQNLQQSVSQNSGSAATLPLIIRSLRSQNVPYLLVSSVRAQDKGSLLTLRLMQVADGITLAQNVVRLDL